VLVRCLRYESKRIVLVADGAEVDEAIGGGGR
jgi:hypothetical protein